MNALQPNSIRGRGGKTRLYYAVPRLRTNHELTENNPDSKSGNFLLYPSRIALRPGYKN